MDGCFCNNKILILKTRLGNTDQFYRKKMKVVERESNACYLLIIISVAFCKKTDTKKEI